MDNLIEHWNAVINDVALFRDLFDGGNSALQLFDFCSGCSTSHLIKNLPDLPGIYLVLLVDHCEFDQSHVIYTGVSTTSIKQRWTSHHKMGLFKATEKILLHSRHTLSIRWWVNPFATSSELLKIEDFLIKKLNPPFNWVGIGYKRDAIQALENRLAVARP